MCLVNHEYRENLRGEQRQALIAELTALSDTGAGFAVSSLESEVAR